MKQLNDQTFLNYLFVLFLLVGIPNAFAQNSDVQEIKLSEDIAAVQLDASDIISINGNQAVQKFVVQEPKDEQAKKIADKIKKDIASNLQKSQPCTMEVDFADASLCAANIDNGDGTSTFTFPIQTCNVQAQQFLPITGSPLFTYQVAGFEIFVNGSLVTTILESNYLTQTICEDLEIALNTNVGCSSQGINISTNAGLYVFLASATLVPDFNQLIQYIENTACPDDMASGLIYPEYSLQANNSTNCTTAWVDVVSPDGSICGSSNTITCNVNGDGVMQNFTDPNGCAPTQSATAICSGCTPGCTDAAYCNFDPSALVDDGSCSGLIGSTCDDGNVCTVSDAIQADCSCSGIIDINSCDISCNQYTIVDCDDGDPCTQGDILVANINTFAICLPCAGTADLTSCDAACTTTLPCDDGDPCTINDEETMASNGSICVPCAGIINPNDADCDGVIAADDCDDNDPNIGSNLNDADCDGFLTNDDCDDNDPLIGDLQITSHSLSATSCTSDPFGICGYASGSPGAVVNVTITNFGTTNSIPLDANGNVSFCWNAQPNLYTYTLNYATLGTCTIDLTASPAVSTAVVDCTNSCQNPISIACGDVVYGSNELAPIESIDACQYGGGYFYDVTLYWYTFIGTGDYIDVNTINLSDNGFYAAPFVLTGPCGSQLCDQDALYNIYSSSSGSSTSFQSIAGTTYYIGIGDAVNFTGNFELSLSCTNDCPTDLTLNGNAEVAGTYQADNWIESTSKVNAATGGSVIYQAGDEYIELQIGFEADGAVDFTAEIEDCDPGN